LWLAQLAVVQTIRASLGVLAGGKLWGSRDERRGRRRSGTDRRPGIELVERLANALEVSLRHLADPRWYAGETRSLPDWEAAILALPASCLADEDKDAIVRFVRTIIAAKKAVLVLGASELAGRFDNLLPI